MLNEAAARYHVKKRVNPHSFRHARASTFANVLTEAQMNEYLGWIPSSRMQAVCVHFSGRNVDNALFKMNGIKTEQEVNEEERPLKTLQCRLCEEVNPPTKKFCARYGAPLDLQTALRLQKKQEKTDDITTSMFQDPKFIGMVEAYLATRNLSIPEDSSSVI
jgi:integrase/recombinase XerD